MVYVKRIRESTEERFWKYVDKRGEGDCWGWIGCRTAQGYGRIGINGRDERAHRFSYKLHKGKIPKDLDILHSCDNPPCVNPKHLFPGTHSENMKDMISKGRGNKAKGETNGAAKLTKKDVKSIRKMYATKRFFMRDIGLSFNCSFGNVWKIVHNKIWKE